MRNVRFYITIVAESEWNSTDAGIFRGLGNFSFANADYEDDHAIYTYDVEYHEKEDLEKMVERLENDDNVISFEYE